MQPEVSLTSQQLDIRKLVGADMPIHRGSWKAGADSWKIFEGNNSDQTDEEESEGDTESTVTQFRGTGMKLALYAAFKMLTIWAAQETENSKACLAHSQSPCLPLLLNSSPEQNLSNPRLPSQTVQAHSSPRSQQSLRRTTLKPLGKARKRSQQPLGARWCMRSEIGCVIWILGCLTLQTLLRMAWIRMKRRKMYRRVGVGGMRSISSKRGILYLPKGCGGVWRSDGLPLTGMKRGLYCPWDGLFSFFLSHQFTSVVA